MRKWSHSRTNVGAMLSLEQLTEDAPDSITSEGNSLEEEIIERQAFEAFTATLSERDRQILKLKAFGLKQEEIAELIYC